MTNLELAVQFFLQIGLILLFCRVVGSVAARFGQPQVVAEMIAGVLLGPSLFGLFWPETFKSIFPTDSLRVLFPISQLGLALYMFVVGLEFRTDIVSKRMRSAVAVSFARSVVTSLSSASIRARIARSSVAMLSTTDCSVAGAAVCA